MKFVVAKTLVRFADRLDQVFHALRPDTLRVWADKLALQRIERMKQEALRYGHYLDVWEDEAGRRYELCGPWCENYYNAWEYTILTAEQADAVSEPINHIAARIEAFALPGEFVATSRSYRHVVFFVTSDASEDIFNKVMDNSFDRVIDTRVVPRFDFGRRTRKWFFQTLGHNNYECSPDVTPPLTKDGERCTLLVLCQTEEALPRLQNLFVSPYWRSSVFKESKK